MRLRIARKIFKAVGTPDQGRYRDDQIGRANARMSKTMTIKSANEFWAVMMATLTERDRRYFKMRALERELEEFGG